MTNFDSTVAVLIPIYKAEMTDSERLSFNQGVKILVKYPVIIVKPESLNIDNILAQHSEITTQSFDNKYFETIAGYNRLLTSPHFYKAFFKYKFILIYQLDALIFSDRLAEWCREDFDYVGAPKIPSSNTVFATKKPLLNGGLSLRKVKNCHRLTRLYNKILGQWPGNEDMLFSMCAFRLIPFRFLMKLPHWKQALHFAFEQDLEESFKLTNYQLPFGGHAWEKYDYDFWKKNIPFLNNHE